MNTRRGSQPQLYDDKKVGSFVRFVTPNSISIEGVLASFNVEDLELLSYARDVNTNLNFDLLIQRDIDETRAQGDISEYIYSEKRNGNELVFLPPLLAAVVTTDSDKELESFYPEQVLTETEDPQGKVFKRTWAPHFQVTHYEIEGGTTLSLKIGGQTPTELTIDSSQSEIALSLRKGPGAKLVVIDGQHRLFALNYLKEHNYHEVKDLLIPVCILFAPDSTESCATRDGSTRSVPDVLRELFVDVNSSAEGVSGHFVILLSDQNLSSVICRSFCDTILNDQELGVEALAQIEWNTRKDKESKTISKRYTLTSIGVINDALTDVLKQQRENPFLRYLINIEQKAFSFGDDEEGNPLPHPKEFPWTSFGFEHKNDLHELVMTNIVPCLVNMYFSTNAYKKVREVFQSALNTVIEKEITDRTPRSNAARQVKDHLLNGAPCEGPMSEGLRDEFVVKFEELSSNQYPEIVRTNVFQKGMLQAWLEFLKIARLMNLRPIDATYGFVRLLDYALEMRTGLFENDARHLYLQEAVYDGFRIKPTVESRKQILRLITALLGNDEIRADVVKVISERDSLDEEEFSNKLQASGIVHAANFLASLKRERIKKFEKTFSADTSLDDADREKLDELYELKAEAKRLRVRDKNVAIPTDFDSKVEELIEEDYAAHQVQLEQILGFSTEAETDSEESEED
jgi:hypothetical protein